MGDAFGESNQWISLNCDMNVNSKLVLREMRTTAFGLAYVFFLLPFILEHHQLLWQMGKVATNLTPSISMQAQKKQSVSVTDCLTRSLL